MTFMTVISIIASLALGWAAWFYGYKKTLTDKAIAFKAKMAKVKEIEEELLDASTQKRRTTSRTSS
jgi:hypothetical protein